MALKNLLSEHEYSALRGVSIRTVRRERALRAGPPFIKLGKLIFYRPEAVDAWLISKEQNPARTLSA